MYLPSHCLTDISRSILSMAHKTGLHPASSVYFPAYDASKMSTKRGGPVCPRRYPRGRRGAVQFVSTLISKALKLNLTYNSATNGARGFIQQCMASVVPFYQQSEIPPRTEIHCSFMSLGVYPAYLYRFDSGAR